MITLYNGNCLEYMRTLKDASMDLIVTDPPYKMTARGTHGSTGGMLSKKICMQGQVFEHNDISPYEYAPEFYRLLKDGSHCYVMTNHVNLIDMLNSFTAAGFHFIKSLIWKNDNRIMGTFYMSQFEYILFFRKGRGVSINNCSTGDVLEIPNIKHKGPDGKNLHDTEKPVELMQILIENSSKPGDVVFDPFMGIGGAGVACQLTGRTFVGAELDKTYFEIAENRIQQESNNAPDVIVNSSGILGANQQFKLF